MAETAFSKLQPSQVVMVGQRDLDEPEQEYIEKHKIKVISVDEVRTDAALAADGIRSIGSDNLYIHIDLDVLDYGEFPYVMVPAPGGLKTEELSGLLTRLKQGFNIVGLSLLEYTSSEEAKIEILSDIIKMGTSL